MAFTGGLGRYESSRSHLPCEHAQAAQFREMPYCYASMDRKPLMPYTPNAFRSRLAVDDAPVPYKNSSTIEFDDGIHTCHKRRFQTTNMTFYTGEPCDPRSNQGVIADHTRFRRFMQKHPQRPAPPRLFRVVRMLPEPGPSLHSGLFRKRTIKEVQSCLEHLRSPDVDRSAKLEVLNRLADYVVDRTVLETTKVGKEIGKFVRSDDSDVAQLAKELEAEWKENLRFRDTVVNGFTQEGLSKKRSQEMEEGLFNFCCPLGFIDGEEKKEYSRQYKRLRTHLLARDEGSLFKRLESQELAARQVAGLPDESLRSKRQQQQFLEARAEGLQAALLKTQMVQPATEDYSCSKCGSQRCMRNEVQTGWHSDQQDLTLFVTCLSCGHRWKEGDDHGLAS
ncbi:unnamed protein product [Effrenium voratum]|nr:unnamed protein product [Effrenium voratum]